MTASTMMIEITIINSSSVKPDAEEGSRRKAAGSRRKRSGLLITRAVFCSRPSAFCILPITVLRPVECRPVCFGGDVEDACASVVGACTGVVEGRVQTPIVLAGHCVSRNGAQV